MQNLGGSTPWRLVFWELRVICPAGPSLFPMGSMSALFYSTSLSPDVLLLLKPPLSTTERPPLRTTLHQHWALPYTVQRTPHVDSTSAQVSVFSEQVLCSCPVVLLGAQCPLRTEHSPPLPAASPFLLALQVTVL